MQFHPSSVTFMRPYASSLFRLFLHLFYILWRGYDQIVLEIPSSPKSVWQKEVQGCAAGTMTGTVSSLHPHVNSIGTPCLFSSCLQPPRDLLSLVLTHHHWNMILFCHNHFPFLLTPNCQLHPIMEILPNSLSKWVTYAIPWIKKEPCKSNKKSSEHWCQAIFLHYQG